MIIAPESDRNNILSFTILGNKVEIENIDVDSFKMFTTTKEPGTKTRQRRRLYLSCTEYLSQILSLKNTVCWFIPYYFKKYLEIYPWGFYG